MQVPSTIQEPLYFHRDYSYDIEKPAQPSLYTRVALASLPFLSLYKPFSFPLSLGLGSLRLCTSLSHLRKAENKNTLISYYFLQTTISVMALAGTLIAHPLGMLISTGNDLCLDLFKLLSSFQEGNFTLSLELLSHVLNHSLYLTLFFHAGLEILIASLATQILLAAYHSQKEFNKGNHLEAFGHLAMAGIRGGQVALSFKTTSSSPFFQKICTAKKQENTHQTPTLPKPKEEELGISELPPQETSNAKAPFGFKKEDFPTEEAWQEWLEWVNFIIHEAPS